MPPKRPIRVIFSQTPHYPRCQYLGRRGLCNYNAFALQDFTEKFAKLSPDARRILIINANLLPTGAERDQHGRPCCKNPDNPEGQGQCDRYK